MDKYISGDSMHFIIHVLKSTNEGSDVWIASPSLYEPCGLVVPSSLYPLGHEPMLIN